jgi:hypothetical protein
MSAHKDPQYQIPELIEALIAHGLATDTPSQLADAFRFGWLTAWNRRPPASSERVALSIRQIAEATSAFGHVRSDYTIGIARAIESAHGIQHKEVNNG